MEGSLAVSENEFSFRNRKQALLRFQNEVFDVLVIGGGITGAAVARDSMTRGLKVALVERKDFAYGTSSRSSKLIHGGLRYLENFEFGLVFEALAERAHLLKTVPNMVKPLPFYIPVYRGDPNGPGILSMGLWLYDVLALFRTPGGHRGLSKDAILREIPFLKADGLRGGFQYYDASMWDDVLAVETLRAASRGGAAVANYVEAIRPIWEEDRISGFYVKDQESSGGEVALRAHRTVICAGPWTDELGSRMDGSWQNWLKASKGVHLIFDLKRVPVPGALVMSHPQDGRIAFVIPRPDFGSGVVIVGTTDGPTSSNPDEAKIEAKDVNYLLELLSRYFPSLGLTSKDILSAYVGVRPLMGPSIELAGSEGQTHTQPAAKGGDGLQKVSREHHIDRGPGGTIVVAGGKYTTHRKMAEEIVDFVLKTWRGDLRKKQFRTPPYPPTLKPSETREPLNPLATEEAVRGYRKEAEQSGLKVPEELISRFAGEAFSMVKRDRSEKDKDPEGFPLLEAQLRHTIRTEMVIHLEDFYLRRVPLYASRKDHGLPWAESLARVWAQERGLNSNEAQAEVDRLKAEISLRSSWADLL